MNIDSTGPLSDPTPMDVDIPSESSLESIADKPYGDGDHLQMDEEVAQFLGTMGKWRPHPTVSDLRTVLEAVIRTDNRLDRSNIGYPIFFSLVKKHPFLESKLEDAWKAESYRDIRNLAFLWIPTSVSEPISEIQLNSLKKGLTATYQGQAVKAFYKYLLENNKAFHASGKQKYYGKFCSIVQSSGTGKTRLMLELITRGVCVIYMNIRSLGDKQGYPPRDNIPADILTRYSTTEDKYRIQCIAFFAAIFKLLCNIPDKQDNWYKDMCNIGSSARTLFFANLAKEYINIRNEIKGNSSAFAGSAIMNKYYQKMVNDGNFLQAGNLDAPRVVIALDEAHVLHEISDSQPFLRSTVLLQTIKQYSEVSKYAVWVVFASTTSKVVHFASPQALFPSARVAVEGQLLFPPFTQLGWDQNSPMLREVQADKVAKAEHILQYGRPLWETLKTGYSLEQLLQLAKEKLYGKEVFNPQDNNQAFAVLAQRFGLNITFGHRNAVQYVETSVASHLRVCINTTDDRLWSYTTYPSEPILSCAAASLLHTQGNLGHTFQQLKNMVNDGMIETGQIGELVSRFLWLLAKDFFVRTKADSPEVTTTSDANSSYAQSLQDCQLVPVTEFLEFVFGSKIWKAEPQAQKMFGNAYINFSHWVSMDFNIRRKKDGLKQLLIEEWTLCHWERTSAVQCCHGQPLIDKVIPMYFKPQKDGDQPRMSQILISDKAHISSQHSHLADIQRTHWSIAPGHQGPPYIAILIDLGVEKSDFEVEIDSSGDKDKCLRIYASGFNAKTYPFLGSQPKLMCILKDLYKQQTPPSKRQHLQALQDQVLFGNSSDQCHMNVKTQKKQVWK